MRNFISRLTALFKAFGVAEKGVAAVEFAMILPILLTLYLGSVELSSTIIVDKRVASVAGALGDLVARADGDISLSDLNDYFKAAKSTMAPYPSTGVTQIVSSVEIKSDGSTKVRWSRDDNGNIAHTKNSSYALPKELTDISKGKYVIVAEAALTYKPLFGYVLRTDFNLYHEFFYLPRFGAEIDLE